MKMRESDYHSFGFKEFAELAEDFLKAKKGSFLSDLFIDYKPRWREVRYKIVLDSLKKAFPERTEYVLKVLHKTKGSARTRYIHFIKAFRKAYRRDSSHIKLLHEIARHLFLNIEYTLFTSHLVDNMEKAGLTDKPSRIVAGNFIDRFEDTWHAIQHAPRRLKIPLLDMTLQFLRGQFNIGFDPFCQENTPYHLFKIASTSFIRMGTPTREGYFSSLTHKAEVNEEFRAFLESYEALGERHLYINLQNRLLGCPGYNESPRCLALENLALEYPKTFFIVTLNKNGSFWHQDGKFATIDKASTFKEALFEEMLSPHSGYHFCKEAGITHDIIKKLSALIHEEFFASAPNLSLKERKDFVELFYTHLIDYLVETLKPHSVNITCKDGIDRAGTSSALYFVYKHLKNKGSLTSQEISHLKALLFAPALLVKKRPPTYERFQRFLSSANHLLSHFNQKQSS